MAAIARLQPEEVLLSEPGEWRVERDVRNACERSGIPVQILDDRHFFLSRSEFAEYAQSRKSLVMEFFYRHMRKRLDVLLENGQPTGGKWNFDRDNRSSFGRHGPDEVPPPLRFEPDEITRDVIRSVEQRFKGHPGDIDEFGWPVTEDEARRALDDFITTRLPWYGRFQDAMWVDQPWLYHSLLSSVLNLRLLNPREVVERAVEAWRSGEAPLAAVEGLVRQLIGWREFIRGVYWLKMPSYGQRNGLGADRPLPGFFWDGDTDMRCLSQSIGQTLRLGYAHHIQRLMIIGNFALIAGLSPRQVCDWFLAVYVDAVEWVELPNTLGMALHGDHALVGTKPYAASANYIRKMSNYCQDCRYRPDRRVGSDACPFNTLYWDFLARHRERFAANPRMSLSIRNLDRLDDAELEAIRTAADGFLDQLDGAS
jgi:deoxyribodipyrimidine photolyase-related protein